MITRFKRLYEDLLPELRELNEYIYANPEEGNREFLAAEAHARLLERHGFLVERQFAGLPTAFRASRHCGQSDTPAIAFMAEYDALPGIGHGCAHNLLGTCATGSAVIAATLAEAAGLSGQILVFGTPAEETDGAKVLMAAQGAFDAVSAALLAHPGEAHYKSGTSLAIDALAFRFFGRTTHAAASPEEGINALDACILTFNNINALRQHIRSDARLHGIISEGGKAANITPDFAEARFYVRAHSRLYLEELRAKVIRCAEAGALATGARMEYHNYESSYDELVTNQALQACYVRNLSTLGVTEIREPRKNSGSLDAGNVSQRCPTIHPYFRICDESIFGHTVEFRDASIKPAAYQGLYEAAGALSLTALELLSSPETLAAVRSEFESRRHA